MRLLRGALSASLAAAALLSTSVATAGTSPTSPTVVRASLEANLLFEVNRLRVRHGLAPLRANRELEAAAGQHSLEMARVGYFAHNGLSGSYSSRLAAYYPVDDHRFWMVGENLIWGSPTISASETMRTWLRSPEHRANLFRPVWREAGVSAIHALAAPGTYQGLQVTIVTFDFGRRS